MELDALRLSIEQLGDVREAVRAQVSEGLAADGERVAALPAYVPPPMGTDGQALVIDLGGTNVRAAVVRIQGDRAQVVQGPVKGRLRGDDDRPPDDADQFFELQSRLVHDLEVQPGTPTGYVFSYPARILPDRDAVLVRWTKGIDIPELVGARVGSGLKDALRREGIRCGEVTVLNDTVATLVGGALRFDGSPDRLVGIIAGTGTNMAAFFHPDRAPKLTEPTAVNLESGNVVPPHLSPWDDEMDRSSPSPGQQRFEKAVSGYYLPKLYATIMGQPEPDSSAELVVLKNDSNAAEGHRTAARVLLERSAGLVAAGLGGVIDLLPDGPTGVLAEGGLFWGDEEYADRVRRLLGTWMPERDVQLLGMDDVNLAGAALAALQARK